MSVASKGRPASSPVHRVKRSRLQELSLPKQSKATWWTSFEPRLVWGNQEPITPISPGALEAVATPRIEKLATPKTDFSRPGAYIPQYALGCGRPSQIWQVSELALHTTPSPRILELARHKTAPPIFYSKFIPQYYYGCGRVSSIWKVHHRTLTCPNRPHTASLAQPKRPHVDYRPCKHIPTIVTESAKNYEITPRMEHLAKPKVHQDGPFRGAQWVVSEGAKQAIPTERVVELAKAKKAAEGYQPCRNPIWKVGMGALNAVSSNRLEELAKPIVRDTMDHVQFNPDAFNVKETALKAKASARIQELAEPITRGK